MSQVDSIWRRATISPVVMSDWRQHGPEFVGIEPYDDGRPIVVVRFRPADAEVLREAWDEVCRAWLDLPPHPAILDAIARSGRELVVRFAAIDWKRTPMRIESPLHAQIAASWGVQLCGAMSCIEDEVAPEQRGWFLCPLVLVDLDAHVRLGFLQLSPHHREVGRFIAPEARATLPSCDEDALVYLVGKAMSELVASDADARADAPLARVIARCLDEDPARRYRSLRQLRAAFRHAGPTRGGLRSKEDLAAWRRFEEDVGWQALRPRAGTMELPPPSPPPRPPPPPSRAEYRRGKELFAAGRLENARTCFERALALEPTLIEAMHLRREVDRCARVARTEAGHAYSVSRDIEEALAKSAHLEAMLAKLDDDKGLP